MAILGLLPKSANISGEVLFRGENILGESEKELQQLRGASIAMIFQDALAALNPVFKVGEQIAEAILVHQDLPDKEVKERVVELLEIVGIPNPRDRAENYPHEFSGGMRQRAMIAMSIANDPDLLIADEPTTALDVTIQAQVLDVLERIQDRTSSSIMLITHDLGVVAGVADRVLVMYAGRQVELGDVDQIFYEPRHPYTVGLLASLPRLDRRSDKTSRLHRIVGQPPSMIILPPGCAFNPRCPRGEVPGICDHERPGAARGGTGPPVGLPLRRGSGRRSGRGARRFAADAGHRRVTSVSSDQAAAAPRADTGARGEGPGEELPGSRRSVQAEGRRRAGGLGDQLLGRSGRDARAGGGVGLREVHDRAVHPAAGAADVRHRALRGDRRALGITVRAAPHAREDADRLPGSRTPR